MGWSIPTVEHKIYLSVMTATKVGKFFDDIIRIWTYDDSVIFDRKKK